MVRDVYSKYGWCFNNKDLEIFFIAGSDDMVIKNEGLFMKSMRFLKDIGYKDITCKLYMDSYHAVFKDKPDEVFNDVLDFIEK